MSGCSWPACDCDAGPCGDTPEGIRAREGDRVKDPTPAPLYVAMWPCLSEEARHHGYALAVHGTLGRDMDLVACPWTDEAAPAEHLIVRLAERVRRWLGNSVEVREPTEKPHGRRAWSIMLGGHSYLDVSVMPRREQTP